MTNDIQTTSTRPYLVRALHEWCVDNGLTPFVTVMVDSTVQVPREFVKNNEIVLNIGLDATSGLKLGNEYMEFKARFGGVPRDIFVPMDRVVAIFARENGQGMAFPSLERPDAVPAAIEQAGVPNQPRLVTVPGVDNSAEVASEPPTSKTLNATKRPSLTRIK